MSIKNREQHAITLDERDRFLTAFRQSIEHLGQMEQISIAALVVQLISLERDLAVWEFLQREFPGISEIA